MREAKPFSRGCVASPHHLATAVGRDVLASGGNAVDAAVATNLTLGVVTPYLCGFGGDLFAIVWRDGPFAYNGSGRAPAAATVERVRELAEGADMPGFGPLSITVPGAPEAWFELLRRFGSRSFAELAGPALRYAAEGVPLSARAADSFERGRRRFEGRRWAEEWLAVYGEARDGEVLRQPGLARTIESLARDGPDAYYRGPIGEAIAEHVQGLGGLLDAADLGEHRGDQVEPMRATYRGLEVLELPPNTQGVTALEALLMVEAVGSLPPDGPERQHLLIEAMKLALADRDAHVTDPAHMRIEAEVLLSDRWIEERASLLRGGAATRLPPGRVAAGGTVYLCAADADGMLVSLIQSNFVGIGSGVTVPGWGVNLQNRGASFRLDPGHVNAVAPRKRPLHTLIPAMALSDGRPTLVFGTMGGDGQAQTHLQLLARIVDDREDVQRAIDAPRWVVSPGDWSVRAESRMDRETVLELRRRGHEVSLVEPVDSLMGHAHAILPELDGYRGATDPRAEGAVLGL